MYCKSEGHIILLCGLGRVRKQLLRARWNVVIKIKKYETDLVSIQSHKIGNTKPQTPKAIRILEHISILVL